MTRNIQDDILVILYEHFNSYPGSPKMLFTGLLDKLFESPSQNQMGKAQGELFGLKKKGWINYELTESGRAGLAWIEPEGIKIAQEIIKQKSEPTSSASAYQKQTKKESEDKSKKSEIITEVSAGPCPSTLGDLLQMDPDCARLIQRDELLRDIIRYFTQTPDPKPNHVVLYGQPMVGKTKALECLSKALEDKDYVPLMVTGQGLNAIDSVDAFAFDLAIQLTNKFKKWARRHGLSHNLKALNFVDFEKGRGKRAFSENWDYLRQIAGDKPPVVIFDEIEHLLDNPEELNPRILTFLDDFIRSPQNGYFILAGSEQIQYSKNNQFNMLIGKGQSIRVHFLDEGSAKTVLSAVKNYFTYEDETLQYFIALCDGHPRILQAVYEATVSFVMKSSGKRVIRKSDIEPILTNIIERTSDFLWALELRLTPEERVVTWLISRNGLNHFTEFEHSLIGLVELAQRHSTDTSVDHYSLRKGVAVLETREWVEWISREKELFRFKLGIIPLWLHRQHISLKEVMF